MNLKFSTVLWPEKTRTHHWTPKEKQNQTSPDAKTQHLNQSSQQPTINKIQTQKKKLIIIIDFFLALPLGLQQSEGVQAVEEREKDWKREREILWRSQWCINWESNREKVDRERERDGRQLLLVAVHPRRNDETTTHLSLTHHAPIFMARLEHLKKWNFWKTLI